MSMTPGMQQTMNKWPLICYCCCKGFKLLPHPFSFFPENREQHSTRTHKAGTVANLLARW